MQSLTPKNAQPIAQQWMELYPLVKESIDKSSGDRGQSYLAQLDLMLLSYRIEHNLERLTAAQTVQLLGGLDRLQTTLPLPGAIDPISSQLESLNLIFDSTASSRHYPALG